MSDSNAPPKKFNLSKFMYIHLLLVHTYMRLYVCKQRYFALHFSIFECNQRICYFYQYIFIKCAIYNVGSFFKLQLFLHGQKTKLSETKLSEKQNPRAKDKTRCQGSWTSCMLHSACYIQCMLQEFMMFNFRKIVLSS